MATDRPRKQKQHLTLLQKGIYDFLTTNLPPSTLTEHGLSPDLVSPSALPKRFTIYEPMLLLSPNALTTPPSWGSLYASLSSQQREALYASIIQAFSGRGVTHLAINAPIAPINVSGEENRMRSPTGLVPLYGDFGERCSSPEPGEADYRNGFWVRTVQNQGIVQVWAPLYTMFSRGNITEKARILGQGNSPLDGLDDRELGQRIGDVSVVDMYAGIGYFVFSYLRRGVGRVWGWEINGWSVEGLRRGCEANGWGCGVVRVKEGRVEGGIEELVKGLDESVRVVVFHGDNSFAAGILEKIRRVMGLERWKSVRHVNLGLLPSSSQAWESACRMVDSGKGGWVHVHENVDISHIDQKREQVRSELGRLWQQSHDRIEPASECRHVEMVKTYAPGVMHCVFDIQLLASR